MTKGEKDTLVRELTDLRLSLLMRRDDILRSIQTLQQQASICERDVYVTDGKLELAHTLKVDDDAV